jgi:hypothetical protein
MQFLIRKTTVRALQSCLEMGAPGSFSEPQTQPNKAHIQVNETKGGHHPIPSME